MFTTEGHVIPTGPWLRKNSFENDFTFHPRNAPVDVNFTNANVRIIHAILMYCNIINYDIFLVQGN